jgi:acetyltransferase-like isoleucine patch superfamily enzyme
LRSIQIRNILKKRNNTFVKKISIYCHPRASNIEISQSTKNDWIFEKTIILDRVAIGSGVVLQPGFEVGAGAVIGAGSVVTKSVPAGLTVVLNPAKPIVDN